MRRWPSPVIPIGAPRVNFSGLLCVRPPVMVALLHWGERWTPDPGGERMFLTETATGRPVAPMAVRSEDGRPLRPQEITAVAGPGADDKIRQLVGWRRRP